MEANGELGYRIPDNQVLLDLADSQVQNPALSVSPDRQWMAMYHSPKFTPFAQLAAEEVSVAGIRIHKQNFNKSRGRGYYSSMDILNLSQVRDILKNNSLSREQKEAQIREQVNTQPIGEFTEDTLFRNVRWSPDSNLLGFLVTKANDVELWIAEAATGAARKLTGNVNCSVAVSSFTWARDSQSVFYLEAVEKGNSVPEAPIPPFSPAISSNVLGKKAAARTYQNLLKNSHDEALFRFFGTSQVSQISVTGSDTAVVMPGTRGIIQSLSLSPNGQYLMTKQICQPFSYLVPYTRFPHANQIWDVQASQDEPVFEQKIPLQEHIPSVHDAVSTAPRHLSWVPTMPASVFWVLALDDGDPRNEVEHRDVVYTLASPFDQSPEELCKTALRFDELDWSDDGFAWLEERAWKTKWSRVHKVQLDSSSNAIKATSCSVIFDRSYEDAYNSPGGVWVNKNAVGHYTVATSLGKDVLLDSPGASPKGYFPFLNRLDTESKVTTPIWKCPEDVFEQISVVLENDGSSFITRRQSNTDNPNLRIYWKSADEDELSSVQLTHYPHPYPWMENISPELVTYERSDGALLSGKLMVPEGFKKGVDDPLPMLIWAYPREFTSLEAANQVKIASTTFPTIAASSPSYWVTQGYAILMSASMPIVSVGKGNMEDANDGFIEQLVDNAQTHVREMVNMKVADPNRIAIAGHSYGAFMTAHLLVHTNLFCAGIARSGTYNRTLTPFGFQAEDRNLWESGDLYYKLSPFNYAHQVQAPLLLIHGEGDCNSGTYPEQSTRFYNALKANGKIARLVILPHEDHGYKGKENILHLLWETDYWLHNFVKNRTLPTE